MNQKPNKPGLVHLLRAHGQDVPSIQRASFESLWQAMALCWTDRNGKSHTAYLYLSTVEPALQIGGTAETVTQAELEQFGLIEIQKENPRAAKADTEAHEDNLMIPQFAALCKG